ncbi:NAD(P)-binding domain-containing protein [Hyphococcus flavus]|uniref:NAD(P)-binding domain-containing protein n=1 Tax=Hyphococcus flavus TaxID=1866326 RepID=A0AAF0CBL9_9PROT|nr:NAD(P)-binding domain-containing protein [Hyphococcus flavus]WDI31300.1 NAD(P)-binding domain-containing protein [Hyphococcus flavus]
MDSVKIAIVGSGPAGLSAAGRASARGVSHVLLEKTGHLSDTIFKYQRGKYIMSTPDQLPLRSDIAFEAGSRESIINRWDKDADTLNVNVRLNSEVTAIQGSRGNFQISLADGATIKAEYVVLAVGVQGNPNKLNNPGTDQPFVQYQLDDPKEYYDENIIVIGGGDAGIENALGLADPRQGNIVTLLQRADGFPRSKEANVQALYSARDQGRLDFITEASLIRVEQGGSGESLWVAVVDTKDGEARLPCDRIIARLGAAPPRRFVEAAGVQFTGPDREAFPVLTPQYESTVPGLYIIGALAGFPLIKHCMNQGHDVVEFISGNTELQPPDTPLLEELFKDAPVKRSVDDWIVYIRDRIELLNDVSPLQMREFLLASQVHYKRRGDVIMNRNDIGSSIFAIIDGTVAVEVDPKNRNKTIPIHAGNIFGELGLISGRRRTATVRADEPVMILEIPRNATLKLMASVPGVKRRMDRISTERQVGQIFGQLLPASAVAEIVDNAEILPLKAGDAFINEGERSTDIFIIRSGSAVVEKRIGNKDVFLSYVLAGNYVGEMSLFYDGLRTATVRAAIKSEVVRLPGEMFERLLNNNPDLYRAVERLVASRRKVNDYIEAKRESFSSVVDMHTSVARFLLEEEGLSEATDALVIDETLCVGCDNCEKACADIHEGISRLDREAGNSYAYIHVPTSCRHCEHPHCMTDCPPDAIHRGPDGEVFIDEKCIGCGNCQRYCPYGVIQMAAIPPKKPSLLSWLTFGLGPGPGEPDQDWIKDNQKNDNPPKLAVKCDMCAGIKGGPACVRACPTGAAVRISPDEYLSLAGEAQE